MRLARTLSYQRLNPRHLSTAQPGWWPTRSWTKEENYRLIAWGCAVGHGYVAEHDLGRTWQEGIERIAWLRQHRPKTVARIEAEASHG